MKRSIAFLLAVVMCIGMIPATLLPVLAHGVGVGVDKVENLSIDNAPNQKIPATVTLDGENNDTAWVSDEWQNADAQYGIWNTATTSNPDFSYRYQLHMDYEFLYGVVELDTLGIKSGSSLQDVTIWLNDGSKENSYSTKIVLTPADEGYSIAMYRHGSTTPVDEEAEGYAKYTYEYAFVANNTKNGILTLEFKGLISSILGKVIDQKTEVNLSAFVSARISANGKDEYLYHPRVDAEQDAKSINLATKWEDGAVEITQDMIYDVNGNPEIADYRDVDSVDYITVDGHLDEEAWKGFTSYGGSGFETFTEYTTYTEGGHQIPNYAVEYSSEYMYHDGTHQIENETYKVLDTYAHKWIHYHEDNVDFVEHPYKADGNIIYSPGYFNGLIWTNTISKAEYPKGSGNLINVGAQKEHVCTSECERAYINNIPVKFKYQVKSNETAIFGALVVDLSLYNDTFYYDTTSGYNTFFKFMIAGNASPTQSNPWTNYAQIELQHTSYGTDAKNFSDGRYNKRVITSNSELGQSEKTDNYGNTVLPDGIGAYARRVNSNTMVFEFYATYEQLNANKKATLNPEYKFEPGKEVSVILSVGNETSPVSWAGCADNRDSATAVHASSANWFGHAGLYDPLGRRNTHRYTLGSDPTQYSAPRANGSLDEGVFNGLIAHDRFVNSAYRNFDKPGAMEFMDYDIFMSTEYLYGAAIVKKNGYENGTGSKVNTFDDTDMFRLWLNNGNAQWRDKYDCVLNFYLDPDASDTVTMIKNSGYSDYTSNGTFYDGTDLEKGAENFLTDKSGVVYSRKIIDASEYLPNYSSGSGAVTEGEVVVIEFKIPLEILGITEKYTDKSEGNDIALSYYVSANSTTSGSDGFYAPIPDNRHLNPAGETGLNFGTADANGKIKEKEFLLAITDNGVSHGAWVCTSFDGVNGARFIRTDYRSNQFIIDGILDEVIWNDEEERIWVNSTSGSWGNEPDVPYMFDYNTAVYAGREYLYGAAAINTAAGDGEELIYTVWIKNDKALPANEQVDGATNKFSIVQKGDYAACYDIKGNEIPLTRDVQVWDTGHEKQITLTYTDGMVAMTNANGITYVEFMFSLEALGITLHEQEEDAWTQFMSYGENNVEPLLPASDKFFYYWDAAAGKFVENKKTGFEYFVTVTKMDADRTHTNTLYYPAPDIAAPTAITEKDKFCHLADDSTYNSSDRWDATNAHEITPLGYFVPETVVIDGDLSDSGWRDDMWIEVKAGVNGNLQNSVEEMKGATEAPYKFQMRADDEYIYVAAIVDVPASPIRYNVIDTGKNVVTYSYPRVRIWLQSHDEDYEITVNHNGLKVDGSTQKLYKFEDAVSFTHLYDVSLGYGKNGLPTNQQLTVEAEQYVPETYVTWEDNDVPHETADAFTKLNDSLKPTALTNTNTLRYAINHTGFFAPYGGRDRKANDIVGVLSYKFKGEDEFTINGTSSLPTVHNYYNYNDTDFYGVTEVIEENTVTAKGENPYTDKDWYAKPEVKKYIYANEHAIMTSDETGTKTIAEFRFPLSDIGCDDGDEFEYFIQGGTDGLHTDSGYTLFYPPITYGFSKTIPSEASKTDGRPYWYWATTGKVVDAEEKERIKLRNNYEPVTPIGAQYRLGTYEGYGSDEYLGIKFGMLYDADYMRQPANLSTDIYQNATYWDLKEIGMMIGYTDYLDANVANLTSDCADDYNIYRVESDVILNHVQNTNMADYESYIFYTTMLLWPDEYDTKLTYRGYVDYYPSDHIYYNMAWKTFSKDYPWTYSTPESNGKYLGKPLALEGVNGDPTKIPQTYTYRPTFYSDPVTRNVNMIRYADDSMKEELPGNRVEVPVTKPNAQGSKILYVPIDDRPINLERVQYQAEAAGFTIVTPPAEYITTKIDTYQEGKSDQGNPKDLYTWLETQFNSGEYSYYIISVDQMFSGGLVGSREPFYDTGDTIANTAILSGYNTETGGYTLSTDETEMVALLKKIAASDASTAIFFDTIKRLASTQDYFAMNSTNYGAFRMYGTFARPQLYGSELTVDNIVKGYNKNSDGTPIAQPLSSAPQAAKDALSGSFNVNTDYYFTYYVNSSGEEITHNVPADKTGLTLKYAGLDVDGYKMYMAARERKLKIANALYSDDATYESIAKTADALYIGYDDSKPVVTMQTNDGRYIEEKLVKGCDNSYVFSGTDELGMMAVAKLATDIYGEVDVNVEFFGIGKDEPGDAYDTGTLYQNVMAHINGIGANYRYNNDGDVDVLILTRSDHYDHDSIKTEAKYSSDDLEQLRIYAGQLIDRVDANLKAGKPTVVVDCAFKDDYLAAMMMQRYGQSYHTADISGRLNQLLAYSQWNTTANSLGTAISNGVSRYTYLKNCDPTGITAESHMAANKVNVKAWIKDYGYQSTEVGNTQLNRSKPFNGETDFGKTYNNFWEISEYIMSKLNASSVATAVNADGTLSIPNENAYRASVSNLWWRWDRSFEANFDINVVPKDQFQTVNYDDYKVVNLALGKNYTSNVTFSNDYPDAGNELTDGIYYYTNEPGKKGYEHPAWVGYNVSRSTVTDAKGQKVLDLVVDLGANYDVYQASIQLHRNTSPGINMPKYVEFYTSTDNTNFTLQRTIQTANVTDSVKEICLGTNTTMAKARYVKLRLALVNNSSGCWIFASEIKVLGLDKTRPEYVSGTGLYFSYTLPDNNGVYKYSEDTMTADSGARLRWYANGDGSYTTNMYNPTALYAGYSKTTMSGWNWNADKQLNIDLKVPADVFITQVAVLMPTDYQGWSLPSKFSLAYEDEDGNFVPLETTTYSIKYVDNAAYDNASETIKTAYDTKFDGYRNVVEIKEGIVLPKGKRLRLTLDRFNMDSALLTGIQIVGKNANTLLSVEGAALSYEFMGDNAETAGFAQSLITITPTSTGKSGYYHVYYVDENGPLAGYDELASIPMTGSTVSYEVPDGTMIPVGATGIAVFESKNAFDDVAPSISTAVAIADIPLEKQTTLGTPEVIFGAASDVHMNYEYYGSRNAHSKWANALNFFGNNGASYVIVTGDMTGDEDEKGHTLTEQYQDYVNIINGSNIPLANVYEALGNHGATSEDLAEFATLNGTDQVHPYANSPYYHVVKEGDAGEKDNVFIFMYLEMDDTKVSDDPAFSTEQIDWFQGLLTQYDNEDNNVFVICHAPFLNYGAGDRYKGGGYTDLLKIDGTYTENNRFHGLLQEHRDVIVMSGHTHLTLYDGAANYSDVNNEFAHTVHVPSTCWPRAYTADGSSCPAGTDGRYSADTADYGSEAYLVSVYADYIVYTGYNLSTGKIIPAACIIIPTDRGEAPTPDEVFKGSGTQDDPYLIEDAQDFLLLTNGFNANKGTDAATGYGYGKYFLQTGNIDLTNVKAYNGSYVGTLNGAGVQYKPAFSGTYNGNGYTITVAIDGHDQRSVFPYVYGTLVNLTIKGSITGSDTEYGCAQPVRSLRTGANMINCYFDLTLAARRTHGAAYSNTGFMHNVYARGVQNGYVADYSIAAGAGEVMTNAYYTFDGLTNTETGTKVITSDVGTVITAFNDRSSAAYNAAMSRLGFGIHLCEAYQANGIFGLGN